MPSAVLVNAVYFKGLWTTPFDAKLTRDDMFHLAAGDTAACKMMQQDGTFRYVHADKFQMAALPYNDKRLEMTLVLPDEGMTLSGLLAKMTPAVWEQWTGKMRAQPGEVKLPHFRAEYSVELSETLISLGMGSAFNARADFSAMTNAPVYISKVNHKTFVDVSEEGTEAAAATAVIMTRSAPARPVTPFRMTLNRPFLYAIRDTQSGALLFLGTVANPVQK